MDMMHEDEAGSATPDWAEPRHAIPDLDNGVGATSPGHHLSNRGPGKDRVPPAASHHLIPIAVSGGRLTPGCRGSVEDIEANCSPTPHEGVGMDLRTASIRIIEIPPTKDVNPLHPPGPNRLGEILQPLGGHGGIVAVIKWRTSV
jgi:hypothetical protein